MATRCRDPTPRPIGASRRPSASGSGRCLARIPMSQVSNLASWRVKHSPAVHIQVGLTMTSNGAKRT